jgi:hypothetical protein
MERDVGGGGDTRQQCVMPAYDFGHISAHFLYCFTDRLEINSNNQESIRYNFVFKAFFNVSQSESGPAV